MPHDLLLVGPHQDLHKPAKISTALQLALCMRDTILAVRRVPSDNPSRSRNNTRQQQRHQNLGRRADHLIVLEVNTHAKLNHDYHEPEKAK